MTEQLRLRGVDVLAATEEGTNRLPDDRLSGRRLQPCVESCLRTTTGSVLCQRAQVFAIPGGRNAFPWRPGAGVIRSRGNAMLAQFTYVPILTVRSVPKLDGVVWPE